MGNVVSECGIKIYYGRESMKRISCATIIVALFLMVLAATGITDGKERGSRPSSSTVSHASATPKPSIDSGRLEKKIHDLVNEERTKRRIPALRWNEQLNRISRRYSNDMAARAFFSHSDPEGRSFMDRYREEGFVCKLKVGNATCFGAENIAQDTLCRSVTYLDGIPTYSWNSEDEIARSVVKMWMGSKGHRENILTPYFRQQAIGIAVSDDGKVYVTENFC